MDEIVNLVSQRTGLPADKAQVAVQTVVGFLKDKLPGPIAGQIESLVAGGGTGIAGGLGSAAKGIEGMFGNQS